MRSIPQAWRQAYIAGNQNYSIVLYMALADGTRFTITNDHIWEGGFSFEEATSDESSFSVGAAIIGKCTVVLDNTNEEYSQYDFFNAQFDAFINLVGVAGQNQRFGHFTVDETSYNGSLITLNALDNLWRFDIPFSDIGFTYGNNTIAREVIVAMCQYSGIGIQLATQQFVGYNFHVSEPKEDMTCREVLQHIAQATCNICKVDNQGNLRLFWYDKAAINNIHDYDGGTFNTTTTPYSDGDAVEGGRWYYDEHGNYVWTNDGDYDGGWFYDNTSTLGYITDNHSMEVGTDGIVVTGVKVCTSNQDNDDAYDYSWHSSTEEATYPRYTLVIQDNAFITKTNASERAQTIGTILAGLHLRSFNASSVSDYSIEAGDPVAINDFRGNRFYSYVTNVRFQTNNPESFSCGVESLTQNKTVRYSNEIKTLVEAQKNAQELVSTYDQAVQRMNNIAVNAMGAYEEYTEDGNARIYYLSNKPITKVNNVCTFTSGSIVYKISGEGFFVSQNGGQTWQNGYSAQTGELVVNVLNAIGINASWINAGNIDAARMQTNVFKAINGLSSTDTTEINGGKIKSGSINANRIGAGDIDAQRLKANTISAINLSTGTIDTARLSVSGIVGGINNGTTTIDGGKITADTLTVSTLDTLSANMGRLTAGEITGTSKIKSYRNNDTANGWTEISGGQLKIYGDSNNYLTCYDKGNTGNYLTISQEHITCQRNGHRYEFDTWDVFEFLANHVTPV